MIIFIAKIMCNMCISMVILITLLFVCFVDCKLRRDTIVSSVDNRAQRGPW